MASNSIQVFEVGPRDGLQNEPVIISFKDKLKLIENLQKAGLKNIEAGAFVRPDRVPQMSDTDQVCKAIRVQSKKFSNINGWYLVPNLKGMERALQAGATRIAVFTAATETFAKKNIGMSIAESLSEFSMVIQHGRSVLGPRLKVRGYISTAFGCPFEGRVRPSRALKVIEQLANLDLDQLSVGDTIGVATPNQINDLIQPVLRLMGEKKTAVHFHDTRGTALANSLRALDLGVKIIDSSAGGLGGCPFAPGAAGNLATEDLVYMLNGMGLNTGIDLEKVCKASLEIYKKIKRPIASRYLQTYISTCKWSKASKNK